MTRREKKLSREIIILCERFTTEEVLIVLDDLNKLYSEFEGYPFRVVADHNKRKKK